MMLTSRRTRRIIFVLIALAVVVGPVLVSALSTTTVSTGGAADEPDPGSGSGSGWGGAVILVVVGLVLLVAVLSLMGESTRFLRLAAGFTTVSLVSVGVSLIFVAGSLIDSSTGFGDEVLSISGSSIEVEGEPGTRWGTSSRDPSDAEERAWMRREFGGGAEYATTSMIRVVAESPSVIAWVLSWLHMALSLVAIGGGLWLLRRLLLRSIDGAPFDPRNASALRGIAGFIALGWFASVVIGQLAQSAVIASAGGEGSFAAEFTLWPLVAALFVLALSEVWRYGIELQREAEVTI